MSSIMMIGTSRTPNEDSPKTNRKEENVDNKDSIKNLKQLLTKFNFARDSVFTPK